MIQKRRRNEYPVLNYLKEIISELPTDARKKEILESLNLISKHIQDMKERILLLPSDAHRNEIIDAIDLIGNFVSSAKENPAIGAALGLPFKRTSKAGVRKISDPQIGERLFKELSMLSTDDIQRRLLDYKSVSLADLRALAEHIGIKNRERVRRSDLVDQIVKLGFANIRGYERLRSPTSS